jgi:hypothetical protein
MPSGFVDVAKWGLKLETGHSLVVCGPFKAGTDNLEKNGGNVEWTDRLLTTTDRNGFNEISFQSTFWRKNQEDTNGLLIFVA